MSNVAGWTFDDITREQVDRVFSQWTTAETPGMTLGIYRFGEPVYLRAYGMSNLEHDIPLATGSIFHVASISKQFTDLCIALLAADGLLGIDDEVRQHIPELPDFGPTITVRHLIHHTSGLRDQWSLLHLAGWREEDLVTNEDVLDLVQRQRALNFEPNTEYLYCNTGYTLLSLIVHRVSGKTLREFAQERIFGPLGMTSTHFHDDHAEIVRGRTQAYQPRDGGGYRISIPEFDVVGTTSLFTTVEDLARWEDNFHTGQVGGSDVIAGLQTPGTFNDGTAMDYAWGLQVATWRGQRRIGHSGADHGYRADFLRLPDLGFAVAVLSNVSDSMPGLLTEQVASVVLGDRLESEVPVAIPDGHNAAAGPSDLAGQWSSEDGTRHLVLTSRDGQAWIDAGSDSYALTEDQPGVFSNALFRLTIVAGNEPDHLIISQGGKNSSFSRTDAWQPSPEDLAAFPGTYWSEELAVPYDIVADGGPAGATLAIRRRKFAAETFQPFSPDTFVRGSLDAGSRLNFQRDGNGLVTGFTFSSGRVRNLAFNRHM